MRFLLWKQVNFWALILFLATERNRKPDFLNHRLHDNNTQISWYGDCNTLLIRSNNIFLFCWGFVKLSEWGYDWVTFFFFLTAMQKFFIYSICAGRNFFSSNKRLQEIFLKITHHPPRSKVKWSALKLRGLQWKLSRKEHVTKKSDTGFITIAATFLIMLDKGNIR